jgi:signal transduction histidine kinase
LTASAKIRLMLALLFASLLLTAIVVQKTYTSKNNLLQTAQTLENNLHKKEQLVLDVINDKAGFENLKTLDTNDNAALKAIRDFTTDESIWLVTTRKGKLTFWSGIKVIPEPLKNVNDGFSFIHTKNGYYDAIKKSQGNFSAIFFIPVKLDYPFQNQYLRNVFAKNLLRDNNIEIAAFYDKNIYEINSITGKYLFSVKVNPNQVSHRFFYFEIGVWSLCFIVLCLLINNCCNYIAVRGYPYLSFVALGLFICLMRILNLFYSWPDFVYRPALFAGHMFNQGALYPSFGDFCINILAASWFVCFVFRYRDKMLRPVQNKTTGYTIVAGCLLVLIATSTYLLHLFFQLVVHSTINFDVNNVLNLSVYSALGILILCFAFLIFYLLVEICLTFCFRTTVPVMHQAAILLGGAVICTLISALGREEFSLFYIVWAVWVLIRGYAYRYDNAQLNSSALVSIILLCAIVSATKLNHFQSIKERAVRVSFIKRLKTSDDPRADDVFRKNEKLIQSDFVVRKYIEDSVFTENNDYLRNYLQKLYFPFLTRYSVDVFIYGDHDQPLPSSSKFELSVFKEMVMMSATKVTDYFYRVNKSFGYSSYFALIPLSNGDNKVGTLVIRFESHDGQSENAYPELLVEDGGAGNPDEFKDYSYAYYVDKHLKLQHGKYDYSLVNTEFKGDPKKFTSKTTLATNSSGIDLWSTYDHLIYQTTDRNVLVVSKKQSLIIGTITSVTFFFIVFLTFSVLALLMRWLWARIKILYIENNYFHWGLKLNFGNILYKTRIQFSIVLAVVITLVMVGAITYFSIVQQYDEQQDTTISDRVTRIGTAFTKAGLGDELENINPDFTTKFIDFANTYSADLTLFGLDGAELASTQPKIYDDGLIAKRINGKAYVNLNKLHKSVLVNKEIIGELNYKAGYAPVENSKGKLVGYLELPYFSNDSDYRTRLGSLLNAMINVYALIFVAIGLLAIIIARQITTPLNIIQQSLSKTIYGQKNEPIKWKRKDEIGTLVNEYNTMISTLEQSAQKLAQSERESAWREMAKQVAHEIKNPLTPLKLGLQLLEKSWRDKDPKFDQKFERFSKSFVEQIESLSSIASEFSAFAKMPETRIERLNVFEVLTQAVVVFKQMDNIRISFLAPEQPFTISADRDQLLRCFNNLLKNAIEAIPQGRQGVIEINHLITNKNILLSIKDNGNGIAENLREKIFEPNFTTKSSGTGLGLAFVKNSIENAGGKVWFETAMGEGTTFYISLPEAQ